MKKNVLVIIILLSFKAFSMEFDLEKAVEVAYKSNRSLKSSVIDMKQQELLSKEAYKEALPMVSLESNYTGTEESVNENPEGYFESGIVLTQPLYSGGNVYYGIKSAEKNQDLYDLIHEKNIVDTRLEVVQEYIKIIQLEKTLGIYDTSIKEIMEDFKRQKEFYNLGLIDKSEILKVESSLYETQSNIIDTKNKISIEKITFKKLLGINLEEKMTLKDLEPMNILVEKIDIENDMEKALYKSLQAKQSNLNVEIAEIEEKASKSDFLPQIDLEYAYSDLQESSFSDSVNTENWQWSVGVSFTWDIFNFGSSLDSYERTKLETEKTRISRDDELEKLQEDIQTAYLNMKTLQSLIETRKKADETLKEVFKIDREKYANRLIETVDYLETEANLREGEVNYVNSQLDYYQAYEEYISLIK